MHGSVSIIAAFWLGISTSIHPCPFATNIAVLFFIVDQTIRSKQVLWNSIMYVAGRTVIYAVLGYVLVTGLISIPETSNTLQYYMSKLIGPFLIVSGMLMLGLFPGVHYSNNAHTRITKKYHGKVGLINSFILGAILALTFCPASAALYFGGLVPLSLKNSSSIILPVVYGIGTGIPVLIFAVLIAKGYQSIEKLAKRINVVEKWATRSTAIFFIALGLFYSFKYVFELY